MTADEGLLGEGLAHPDDSLPLLDPDRLASRARRHRRSRWLAGAATALVLLAVAGGTAAVLQPGRQDAPRPVLPAPPRPTAAPTGAMDLAATTAADARRVCREHLDVRLPGGTDGWQESAGTDARGVSTVNVWTEQPNGLGAEEPYVVPDYVCTVWPAGTDGTPARVIAVRPDIGTPSDLAAGARPGGTVLPLQVAQLGGDAGATFSPGTVRVGLGAAQVLVAAAAVFPRLPVLAPCVERVTLQLRVQSVTGAAAGAQLGVYPSAAYRSFAEGRAPDDPAESALLWATRPRGTGGPGLAPGGLSVDVTDLYRAWVDDRFTDPRGFLPDDAAFAVVLRPPDGAGPAWSAELGAQPRLVWTGRDGCR